MKATLDFRKKEVTVTEGGSFEEVCDLVRGADPKGWGAWSLSEGSIPVFDMGAAERWQEGIDLMTGANLIVYERREIFVR
jgi:hypothetical protein